MKKLEQALYETDFSKYTDLKDRLARSDRLVSGEEAPALRPSGEEGHLPGRSVP